MFGKSSLLGESSATGTEERGFLAVVPDRTILVVKTQHSPVYRPWVYIFPKIPYLSPTNLKNPTFLSSGQSFSKI